MIYTEFAKFYDDLFDVTLYDRWAHFVVTKAKSRQIETGRQDSNGHTLL